MHCLINFLLVSILLEDVAMGGLFPLSGVPGYCSVVVQSKYYKLHRSSCGWLGCYLVSGAVSVS